VGIWLTYLWFIYDRLQGSLPCSSGWVSPPYARSNRGESLGDHGWAGWCTGWSFTPPHSDGRSFFGSSPRAHKTHLFPPTNLQASGIIQSKFTLSLKAPHNFNEVVNIYIYSHQWKLTSPNSVFIFEPETWVERDQSLSVHWGSLSASYKTRFGCCTADYKVLRDKTRNFVFLPNATRTLLFHKLLTNSDCTMNFNFIHS